MLGCVGSRQKTGMQPSSVVPTEIRHRERAAESLKFDFTLQAAHMPGFYASQVSCSFEYLDEGTLSSAWVPLPDASWHFEESVGMAPAGSYCEAPVPRIPPCQVGLGGPLLLAGAAAAATDALGPVEVTAEDPVHKLRCLAEVRGLKPERTYTLRVAAKCGERELLSFSDEAKLSTAERPKVIGSHLVFLGRTADTIEVSVKLLDPDGAPIQVCQVQFRPDSMISGWDSANLEEVKGDACFIGQVATARCWRGTLRNLQGSTQYRLRARAQNAVGWSWDCTAEISPSTSDRPEPPEDVVCLRRHATSATLGYRLRDPDGAPVTSCAVHVHGAFGYSLHSQCTFRCVEPQPGADGRYPRAVRKGLCIVEGLAPETEYCLKLGAQNDVGPSRQLSAPVQFKTSCFPPVVGQAAIQVGPQSLALTWEMQDPIGAPLGQLELEYAKDTVFGSWEKADAAPVAVARAGRWSFDEGELAAAVVVAQLTGSAPVLRHWHVQLDGLERETGYLLRARARNSCGWSPSHSAVLNLRTSDRPPMAYDVKVAGRLPAGVWLECSVDEVLGTAPVSAIVVEVGGSFSWSEVSGVESQRVPCESATASRWRVFVPLGITPGVAHEVRLWAVNVYGRSSKPSAVCSCRTSDKPPVPARIRCLMRLPHSLLLEWSLPDPEGAPVWKFEVQYRSDAAFSSWQTTACPDLERRSQDLWCVLVEDLDAMTGYRIVARAFSEVGWSDWSSEAFFETSSLPLLGGPSPDVFRAVPTPEGPEEQAAVPESVVVDLQLEDPIGAPILACMMRCKDSGMWTLASRRSVRPSSVDSSPTTGRFVPLSRWSAILPLPRDVQRCTVTVKAANAVGWSLTKDHRAIPVLTAGRQQTLSEFEVHAEQISVVDAAARMRSGTCTTLDLVSSEVCGMLASQQEAQQRVVASLTEASGRKDELLITALSLHGNRLGQRIQLLQEVTQHLEPDKSAFGENYGAELTAQLQEVLQRSKLAPDGQKAATVLALLLRAYLWLETSWRQGFESMTTDIAKAKGSIPESGGGVLMQWISQSQGWSDAFQAKVGEALPEGLARAAQLLATLASGRKLAQLEHVRADLEACLTLVSAAERQLRKLRHSHRILCAAEASKSHDFEKRGALKKIETTALGLVTMLVMPVPGSMEVGAINIGMLWLAGDDSNSHVAVEHPTGQPLAPMLERLGSAPPLRAAVILRGWDSGGHKGVVLVHNATARRICAAVLPGETETFGAKAAARFAEAHPYIRGAQMAMSQKDGGDSVAVIPPTDVALIHVPPDQGIVRLEFSYGTGSHVEKCIGRAAVSSGSAVSFMCLDGGLQVRNSDGEHLKIEDSTIRVVNNDLAAITVLVYRPAEARKHFEGALSTTTIKASEVAHLPLPHPCTGCIFELEIRCESGKLYSEVRPGQCLLVDSTT